jgi:transposase-like protein
MRQASKRVPHSAEKTVRDIRRATRRHHSAEEKIRNVLEGLRGEDSVAELCRKEGINQNLYYRWSKEFLEAGKKRLACDDRNRTPPTPHRCRARDSDNPRGCLPQ